MGYTHYFEFKNGIGSLDGEILGQVEKLLNRHKDILRKEYDSSKPVEIRPSHIRFNGIGEKGYETFYLCAKQGFNFCKTARKAYDIAVCEVLLAFKHHYGKNFVLDSDGFSVSETDAKRTGWTAAGIRP